jgi:hypothetical protein
MTTMDEGLGPQRDEVDPDSNGIAPKGRRFSTEQFVGILRDIAMEARHGGTLEGTLAWEAVGEDEMLVEASFRVGNDMGQGGVRLIRRDMGGMGRVVTAGPEPDKPPET